MKKLFLIVVGVLAISGVVIFRAVNKGPVNIIKAKALEVAAPVLYSEYFTDSSAAAGMYTAKILQVKGVVAGTIPASGTRNGFVKMNTAVDGAYINCSLDKAAAIPAKGQLVTIRGICSGLGEGDAELGLPGDVYLSRCIIIQ